MKTANKGISKPKQMRKQVASDSESDSDAEDPELVAKSQRIKSSDMWVPLVGQRLRLSQLTKMLSHLRDELRKRMPMAMVDKMI